MFALQLTLNERAANLCGFGSINPAMIAQPRDHMWIQTEREADNIVRKDLTYDMTQPYPTINTLQCIFRNCRIS